MKMALAQMNPVVGELKGNALKITEYITKARNSGCELAVFPELSLTGSPLQGLVRVKDFIRDCGDEINRIAEYTDGIGVLVGTVYHDECNGLHNAALLIENRQIVGYVTKQDLPSYGRSDKYGNTSSPSKNGELVFRGERLSVVIGGDIEKESYNELFKSSNIIIKIYKNKKKKKKIK